MTLRCRGALAHRLPLLDAEPSDALRVVHPGTNMLCPPTTMSAPAATTSGTRSGRMPNDGVTEQDTKIAGLVHKGKAAVIVVNKWDAVENKETNTMRDMEARFVRA